MAKNSGVVQEGTVQLDPGVILADNNSRYGLKRLRIESLMQSILEQNGVMQAVEVEPLATPQDGKLYRLTAGFYRHAAVTELNEKQGAGITLPATVKAIGDDVVRLKRQLAENLERENQSPMDQARAIELAMEAGIPKMEIRKIFSVTGGRKGMALQPASNSFINMRLSFLSFPKPIQEKIHDGRLGVAAAYQLTKAPREKWDDIMASAEEDRLSQIEKEEKEEEKFLLQEKKAAEAKDNEVKAQQALEAAKVKADEVRAAAQAKIDAAAEAYRAMKEAKGKEDKAKAEEAFKAAEAESKNAEKSIDTATKEVEKAQNTSLKAAKLATEKTAQLAAARTAAAAKAKSKDTVSPAAISKAAKKEGVEGKKPLNATEMRAIITDLKAPGAFPKVREIATALDDCFSGGMTDRQLYSTLAVITGEKKHTKADEKAAAKKATQ